MAPGRRRGARGSGTKRELTLGDLVLAKVKGFPAWPARISKPEDWEKTPDPKKYFVYFFGTSEIGFVAPADIQEFTHEVKNRLCERGKLKTAKNFDQALRQICEEFEKLQHTNLKTGRDAGCSQVPASDADSLDQAMSKDTVVIGQNGAEIQGLTLSEEASRSINLPSASENCSHKHGAVMRDSHKNVNGSLDDGVGEMENGHKSIVAIIQKEKTNGSGCRNLSSSAVAAGKVLRKKASTSCRFKGNISKSGIDAGNTKNEDELVVGDLRGVANEEYKVMTRRKMSVKVCKSDDIKDHAVDEKLTSIESKTSTAVKQHTMCVETSALDSKDSVNEGNLPPEKRLNHTIEVTPSALENSDVKSMTLAASKDNLMHPEKVQSPVLQLPKKRRAVRLCDMDDDELPKTPVHGGSTSKSIPQVSDPKNKKVRHLENSSHPHMGSRKSETIFGAREQTRSRGVLNHQLSPASNCAADKNNKESSVAVAQLKRKSSMDTKVGLSAEGSSAHSIGVTLQSEEQKIKTSDISVGNISQEGTPGTDDKSHPMIQGPNSIGNQSHIEMDKPAYLSDPVISFCERFGAPNNVKTRYLSGSQISTSVMSMKHLIAAAQERKRQARTLNSHGYPLLFFPDAEMPGCSPGPSPTIQAIEPGYMSQLNIQGPVPSFPECDVQQYSFADQNVNEELDDKRIYSGNQATSSALTGDTEASVARDAFEGMIETLSRTKESIGRATRHAIDCARYGIAKEVVELLIRKLESEPSLRRKVDLFFLVDSITQCSHGQRGIAGESYIPVVKSALTRLVVAAAPSGAKENRRQCLKVLRLWLERKIMPESVLRACIDHIGQARDDSSNGLSQRRPSRSERAIDDPIREMEGIVVDEYGSNATFQLPGLLSGHAFEEDEEYEETIPAVLGTEIDDTPSKNSPSTSRGRGNHVLAPSEGHHCILEDVDGELEMEDVSGNQKDEKIVLTDASLVVSKPSAEGILRSGSSISTDSEYSPEGPPPLPSGSPPPSPYLPSSPPPALSLPPSPPPLPTSSPPPQPPTLQPLAQENTLHVVPAAPPIPPPVGALYSTRGTLPLVAPPPPTGAPPVIPAPPPFEPSSWPQLGTDSLPPMPFGPPPLVAPPPSHAGHPQSAVSQPSFVSHPPIYSQHMPQVPPGISHTLQLAYQPPRSQHEIGGFLSVNQTNQTMHDSSIRSEVMVQQSSCFSSGISAPIETVGYPSRPHSDDAYANSQVPQQWQHYPPGGINFTQGPVHPEVRHGRAPGHFSYLNTSHSSQHPCHSSTNISDGSNGGWIPGGRPRSGYFGSTFERPPANSLTFQHPSSNTMPSSSQIPAHSGPAMMPYRADSSSINWKPS